MFAAAAVNELIKPNQPHDFTFIASRNFSWIRIYGQAGSQSQTLSDSQSQLYSQSAALPVYYDDMTRIEIINSIKFFPHHRQQQSCAGLSLWRSLFLSSFTIITITLLPIHWQTTFGTTSRQPRCSEKGPKLNNLTKTRGAKQNQILLWVGKREILGRNM